MPDLPVLMTLVILVVAIILFVTERLRMDLVALLVLASLAVSGLVTPAEALSGFSNLAVVTATAVFVLSGGLSRTGVAGLIGRQVLRLAGQGELRLLIVIMLAAAGLSAFMNNIGVAALLLPVVVDVARRTGRPPSKFLMPLAFAALLGGLVTLIGTPPNILISEALRDANLRPFLMFDFAPVGLAVMLAGIIFMAVVGRHLLPSHDIVRDFQTADRSPLQPFHDFRERLFMLRLPAETALVGKTLAESRLGSALGINVIAIIRNGRTQLAPGPETILRASDRLLVEGRLEQVSEFRSRRHLVVEQGKLDVEALMSPEIGMAEVSLSPRSALVGQTLEQLDFRRRFGVNVLAIWREGIPRRTNLRNLPLQLGDVLLVQGPQARIEDLRNDANFLVSAAGQADVYRLHERLVAVTVPAESALIGKTLAESRLGDAFGLTVLGILRAGMTHLMPAAEEHLQAGDTLLVEGRPEDLLTLRGLQDLEIEREATPPMDLSGPESEQVGLAAVVLSPLSTLTGKTLRQLHFRDKYGLSVLAIWREGQAYRSNLRDIALRFGDALLLHGRREKLRVLGSEPEFLVLTQEAQEPPLSNKALLSALIMAGVLLPVILGWAPIAIAAVVGVVLMVMTGCMTMDEAYRAIEWKAIFLIAGMLPLGIAMERSGAARFLADGMVAAVGGLGPLAVVAALFILGALSSQVMPTLAVAVLLAPIALNTAHDLGISPYPLMMTVAISASAAFLSPVGHSANALIMGPGGYRFTDYIKVGAPLTLVVLLTTLLTLPRVWPF
ncbi:MAG: TRAP transporter large permease subunit [Chloroflexi bacterium]|nr:TRAP transporter large permease subunit [Chloroflexota bacterium]